MESWIKNSMWKLKHPGLVCRFMRLWRSVTCFRQDGLWMLMEGEEVTHEEALRGWLRV